MEVKSIEYTDLNTLEDPSKKQKFPYQITKDGVKWLITVLKVCMNTLCVWPERQNIATDFVNVFFIGSFALLIVAQMAFILDENTDIASAVDAITGIVSSFEAGGRRLLGVLLAKRISKILNAIYYEFWPSDIAGQALHRELSQGSRILIGAVIFEAMQAFSWGFQCGMFQLSRKKLPLSSKFWFSYMQSPFYEIVYVWESVMCIDLPANICTFDFFLLTLIWQCVAQFRLLKKFLQQQFGEIVRRGRNITLGERTEAMNLILIVIRRHNSLINTCKEIEGMLTVYIFILYAGTVGTVCLSSFLLTVVKSQISKAVPYFLGHMIQIFMYCFVGNELIIESTELSDFVVKCGWHLVPYERDLQKALVLIMVRSQKPITLSVGGFGVLGIPSFMMLLRFCFSVYTFLSSAVRRNEQLD